ncbi:UbiA family prenyltransferase [Streptomyces sp. NPDC048416]|uniref:UbiA family prenyltransferase n=1 Tax=Streptomyces sp. NPDC048416 TaxID=3365546 RepID=UPI003713A2EA
MGAHTPTASGGAPGRRERPATGRALLLLLRSCSIRFTAYYWVGFTVGLAANDRLNPTWALLGVPLWVAYCVGTESLNRLADREADVINRPERTRLCEEFGWARLMRVCVGAWAVFALIGAALVWQHPGIALPVMLLIDMGVAIGYSIGPAFKRHRVLSLIALTTPMVTPLLTGWAIHGDGDTLASPVLPVAAVLASFSLGLAGIKDITDVEGDRELNYSSLWLALVTFGRGAALYTLIGLPFLLLALSAALGGLPVVTLVLLPLVVVSALVVTAASRAETPPDREAAREVMHNYTFYFLALALLVAVPGTPTACVFAAGVVFWLLASKGLHWSGGLSVAHLGRWGALSVKTAGK